MAEKTEKKSKSGGEELQLRLLELFEKFRDRELEFEKVEIHAEELELLIQPMLRAARVIPKAKPVQLASLRFEPMIEEYPSKITEVTIGATNAQGGSRGSVVKLGGNQCLPFHVFEKPLVNKPLISMDLFDMPLPLPKAVKEHIKEVMGNPAEWAKFYVDKLGAKMVSLHLISTDPLQKDTNPQQAAKTVEEVLQAVKVPILVGGSGNPEKDPLVFEKVCEVAAGERVLINSLTMDNDYKRIAKAVKKHGHVAIAFTAMDVNNARQLNRKLLDPELGLGKEDLVMDPNTGALGYGLEYGFSVFERIRIAALRGDPDFDMPIMSGSSNAWGARESFKKNPELGPYELRGPLWETLTGLAMLLAGADLMLLVHPLSFKLLSSVIDRLSSTTPTKLENYAEWISMKN